MRIELAVLPDQGPCGRPNSFSRIGNGAQARKAPAPQRVFQNMNRPSRFAREYRSFADQLIRAADATVLLIAEGANRFSSGSKRHQSAPPSWRGPSEPRPPPRPAQSEPPHRRGATRLSKRASHAVQGSLDLFEIVTLDASLSIPAPVSMGQRGAGSRFAQSPPLGGRPAPGRPSAYAAENGSRLLSLPHTLTTSSNQPILWSYLVVSCARPCSQQEPAFPESS